jgi:magnesium-transporting ATPase (P-type)
MEVEEVLNYLGSNQKGLSEDEAALRLRRFGYNEFERRKGVSPFKILRARLPSSESAQNTVLKQRLQRQQAMLWLKLQGRVSYVAFYPHPPFSSFGDLSSQTL